MGNFGARCVYFEVITDRIGRRASDREPDGSISKLLRVGLYEHQTPVIMTVKYFLAVEEIN